jgi:hypothetical protein
MKLIGVRRALILVFLLVLNLAVAFVYLGMIEPMRQGAESSRNGVVSQISDLQSRIQNIKQELDLFHQNLPKYQALETRGFFLGQDRFKMGRDLGDVRTLAGLSGFSYNINDIKTIDNNDTASIQMNLIASRIQVSNVVTLLDNNVYTFLDMMNEAFPAHVRLNSFTVKKSNPLSEAALTAITKNQQVSLMTAEATFDWLTIVPIEASKTEEGGQP